MMPPDAQADAPGSEPFHLVIVGAGLAGLATALSTKLANPSHRVTILEAVKELQEIGAGLQLTPNGTRLLHAWGLAPALQPHAASPATLSVHRWDGTRVLAHEARLQEVCAARYGAPFWDVHRVALQRALVRRCGELGVQLRLGARVVGVRGVEGEGEGGPRAVVLGGEEVGGDVLLVADGLWSELRGPFLSGSGEGDGDGEGEKGRKDQETAEAIPTGDLAYRIVLPVSALTGPDAASLAEYISTPRVSFWIGPGTHCVGYTVLTTPPPRSHSPSSSSSPTPSPAPEPQPEPALNLVFLAPDTLPPHARRAPGSPAELRARFPAWDPQLGALLAHVAHVDRWRLSWLPPLARWTTDGGRAFLAGDACHPMLPYLAQGANSSLEDGAVLGWLLGRVGGGAREEVLARVARVYQRVRMARGARIQRESFAQREDFHLADGPAQEARDALMLGMLERGGEVEAPFPSRWTCPEVQAYLYGYDAYAEAERAWKEDSEA